MSKEEVSKAIFSTTSHLFGQKKPKKAAAFRTVPGFATGAFRPCAPHPLPQGRREFSGAPQAICLVMGTAVTPEMTERPQEALFAEAGWDEAGGMRQVDYVDGLI